ncbi:MAG: hypothetical protein V2B20_23655 [Pseudomonadota bacterium]
METSKQVPTGKQLPSLDDYSGESISQAVRRESFLHPMVLYPTAIGMLSGLAAMIYNLPLLFVGMGGLLAVGAGTSVINYFFREKSITGKYLEKLSQKLRKEREQLLVTLSSDLESAAKVHGAEQYGRQGLEQFALIEKKYQLLHELLQKKFKVGELTYGSFLGAAEQVRLGVLDNLLKIVTLIQSAKTIDPEYIAARIQNVQFLKKVTEADEREWKALQKQLELRENQLEQVNVLITENEESMTAIDQTIAAIAEVQTGKGLAEVDVQSAISYLQEVAGRTKLFEHQTDS